MVKAMAECNEVLLLIQKESPYADLYADMAAKAGSIPARTHGWDPRRVVRLSKSLGVAETAEKAIAESTVRRLKLEARERSRILPLVPRNSLARWVGPISSPWMILWPIWAVTTDARRDYYAEG